MKDRDDLFTDMLKLVRGSTDEEVRDLLVTAWNHGKASGFRECREMMAAPPNGKAGSDE